MLCSLVSTDAAARGLDLPETATVVNYEMPPRTRLYAHRAGRTARAGRQGAVLTLLETKQVRSTLLVLFLIPIPIPLPSSSFFLLPSLSRLLLTYDR